MLRFLADENVNRNILRGIARARPIDVTRAQDAGLAGKDDVRVLGWAAADNRVVLSHDLNTLAHFAWNRVAAEQHMPGAILIPPSAAIAQVIEDLLLIDGVCGPADIEGQIWYLPLR